MEACISSRQNPRVRAVARLRERGEREERGLFLVEGLRELSRALAARKGLVVEVYFCPALFKNAAGAEALLDAARRGGAELCELGAGAFEKVSGREGADGLLGVARAWDVSLGSLALPEKPLVLVAEAVEKPGNLGALFRTADSAGCAALICCDAVADVFNAGVVRASQGAVFAVPCAVAAAEEAAAFLEARKIAVFAAAPGAAKRYWEADWRGAAAVLLGSEKDGLSAFWRERGGVEAVSIPQAGLSDSLNVGVAGAVCLFEAARQRIVEREQAAAGRRGAT
jgi:TrmH family RNA methyltransferase